MPTTPAAGPADPMVVLITGANKGIGYEIAAQLAALGHTVVLCARDLDRGEQAAQQLRKAGGAVSAVQLDVTDPASIAAAAATVKEAHGRLDALINNAGISRAPASDRAAQRPSTADLTVIRAIFDTNVFGVISVTNTFLPLLRRSTSPRIVNVSSSSGSLTARSDPAIAAHVYAGLTSAELPIVAGYVPSKTALNALTLMYAADLRPEGILVNAVDPGFTATDLNNHRGHRTPARGATAAVHMATTPTHGLTGTFTNDTGPIPW